MCIEVKTTISNENLKETLLKIRDLRRMNFFKRKKVLTSRIKYMVIHDNESVMKVLAKLVYLADDKPWPRLRSIKIEVNVLEDRIYTEEETEIDIWIDT